MKPSIEPSGRTTAASPGLVDVGHWALTTVANTNGRRCSTNSWTLAAIPLLVGLIVSSSPIDHSDQIPFGHNISPFSRSSNTPDVLPERFLGGMWCQNEISSRERWRGCRCAGKAARSGLPGSVKRGRSDPTEVGSIEPRERPR
jgi:hypothetical protein